MRSFNILGLEGMSSFPDHWLWSYSIFCHAFFIFPFLRVVRQTWFLQLFKHCAQTFLDLLLQKSSPINFKKRSLEVFKSGFNHRTWLWNICTQNLKCWKSFWKLMIYVHTTCLWDKYSTLLEVKQNLGTVSSTSIQYLWNTHSSINTLETTIFIIFFVEAYSALWTACNYSYYNEGNWSFVLGNFYYSSQVEAVGPAYYTGSFQIGPSSPPPRSLIYYNRQGQWDKVKI